MMSASATHGGHKEVGFEPAVKEGGSYIDGVSDTNYSIITIATASFISRRFSTVRILQIERVNCTIRQHLATDVGQNYTYSLFALFRLQSETNELYV